MSTYHFTWTTPKFYTEYVESGKFSNPKILYKYRDWTNKFHKTLLTETKVYLASPKSFEDPLDCHVPEDFPEPKDVPSLLYKMSYNADRLPIATHAERLKYVQKHLQTSPLLSPLGRIQLAQEFYQEFCDIFGVLSLTADPNSDDMWEKYGANYKGFCVGFDIDLLENAVGGAGPVIYTDELPHVRYFKDSDMEQHIKNVFFKEKKWRFEQEYRAHKIWNHKASNEERNIQLPPEAIKEIIIGKDMDEKSKNEIIELAKLKYPQATIKFGK